ncbi:MAG: DUF971 domain-containing protein [Gammaproteobacteria bacterium]|nr:DUF971 domain-containing protein [Gammaproteobacteria bacterium]
MANIDLIKLKKKSRLLEMTFDDGFAEYLEFEFLRVHSPSAEVRGHGKGQEILQIGKQDVDLLEVVPVGNYAVKLVFDDGHDSGIYTWDYLYQLCTNKEKYWSDYKNKLANS